MGIIPGDAYPDVLSFGGSDKVVRETGHKKTHRRNVLGYYTRVRRG